MYRIFYSVTSQVVQERIKSWSVFLFQKFLSSTGKVLLMNSVFFKIRSWLWVSYCVIFLYLFFISLCSYWFSRGFMTRIKADRVFFLLINCYFMRKWKVLSEGYFFIGFQGKSLMSFWDWLLGMFFSTWFWNFFTDYLRVLLSRWSLNAFYDWSWIDFKINFIAYWIKCPIYDW